MCAGPVKSARIQICGPRLMGLPKIMPPTAVSSIQTGLRQRVSSSIDVLCRFLLGGGTDRCANRLHDAAGVGQSRFPQSAPPPDQGTGSPTLAHAGSAVERRHQPSPGRRRSHAATTEAGSGAAFRPFSAALLVLLRGYKLVISPLLPSACRFYPTCSCYMHDAIAVHGAGRGIYLGVRRLLKCHPWHPGGIDPVPHQRTELHGRQ